MQNGTEIFREKKLLHFKKFHDPPILVQKISIVNTIVKLIIYVDLPSLLSRRFFKKKVYESIMPRPKQNKK